MVQPSAIGGTLTAKFGDAVSSQTIFRGQESVVVAKDRIVEVCTFLRDDPALRFDMLTDLTAVDYMGRIPRFQVVYFLYSFANNRRVFIKADVGEGETISTVEGVWKAANWLEREVYDLFGIVFDGHSDLRRLMLWDGYIGHPLRKDFPLTGIPQTALYR
jgi:NADH-quinone oxidoreductase subunit C